jgi:hypothetical protein
MPLKHAQETRLVFLLGFAIALAGITCAVLPPLPSGIVPWVVAMIVAVLYPMLLSGMLRRNRADNTFRRLHWFPAGMLLLWFVLQGGAMFFPDLAIFAAWYAWGWTLPLVVLGFFLLLVFCLQVIRQRVVRILLLALLFVPFATGALVTEQQGIDLPARVTAFVNAHRGDVLALLPQWGSGSVSSAPSDLIAGNAVSSSISEDTNLDPSDDPQEERWRASLRALKERMDRVMMERWNNTGADSSVSSTEGTGSLIAVEPTPPAPEPEPTITDTVTDPTHLPASGMELGFLVVTLIGSYSAAVHGRAKKRFLA